MLGLTAAGRLAAGALLLLLLPAPARAAGEWQVPESPLRYKLDLVGKPTHPSAGYFAQLPDGGILHGASPATVVMTEDGRVVPSFLLWQNAVTGFSIVFGDPGAKSVYVYTRTDKLAQPWFPQSGLTPSALLAAFAGRDRMTAAQDLAKFGRVEEGVHVENKAGIPTAPLSIGGDDTGRPRPAVFYLLAYVDAAVAGKYWIAPFIRNGAGEVAIDGNTLSPKAHSKVWGGTGASVDLTAGLHRLEVFQTAPGTDPYGTNTDTGGLMFLTWRPPKETLKGAEARILKDTEIARSGACTVTAIETKDGSPVAGGEAIPGLTYWVGDEEPLLIYELKAFTAGQPADATYTWTLPEGATVEGKTVSWLFPGLREQRIKLTVKSAKGTSQCVLPFFSFGTQQTSLDQPAHREAFRNVLAAMLQTYPASPDPVAKWSDAYWNNLLRTVDRSAGYPVLLRLFTDHWEAARKRLGPGQLFALEDLLLDAVVRDRPREALPWLQKFAGGGTDTARQNDLRLREAEVQMYYLGDRKAAAQILTALSTQANEAGERAKIRLGDLAFLEGDLNQATSLYADVQNRARTLRNSAPLPGGLVANQLVAGGPARATPPDWRNSPLALQNKGADQAPERRGGALQEVSLSENVRTLTEGDYLLEAQRALDDWEAEFPLSKISGDFIMRESALYMKTGDWKRAQPMLEAYCREIDASSFLPEAAGMLITCARGAGAPPDSIRDVIVKVKDRLKYHPVAADLDKFLQGGK